MVAIGERDAAERGTGLLQTSIDCEHLSLQQALAWHGTLTPTQCDAADSLAM